MQRGSTGGKNTKFSKKPKVKANVGVSLSLGDAISQRMFMPEASRHDTNGWQASLVNVKSRIGSLFNNYTLSDVVFDVEIHEIPAHKFILASASPVFYRQLYEERDTTGIYDMSAIGTSQIMPLLCGVDTTRRLTIEDTPHLAFFEFLQFIYTDNVSITLENVLQLLCLCDTYKVAGLSGRCVDFLRSEVVPNSVLRVLKIVRTLLLKAIVCNWRQDMVEAKAMKKSVNRRRERRESSQSRRASTVGEESEDGTVSRAGSRANSRANSRRGSFSSRRSAGNRSARESVVSLRSVEDGSDKGCASDVGDCEVKRSTFEFDKGFKGSMLDTKVSQFCEEISMKCWKCIQDQTDIVLVSADLFDQDLTVVREILKLETCNVSEICFFRALNAWAERRCKKLGMDEPTAEQKRKLIGEENLLLIRFPTMTLDQFQWEVVPTGMLDYEDVQQVLSAVSSRGSAMCMRYKTEARSNRTLSARFENCRLTEDELEAALVTAGQKPGLYEPVADDPLDCMLSGGLLRFHLKQTVEDHNVRSLVQDDVPPQSARLPPIGATPATPSGYSATSTPSQRRPGGSSVGPRRTRKPGDMVLGARVNAPAPQPGEDSPKALSSRRPVPEDFKRLAPGLYRFRENNLVELWIEASDPNITNHGYWPSTLTVDESTVDVRAALGLPLAPPYGKGMPLATFLCRA